MRALGTLTFSFNRRILIGPYRKIRGGLRLKEFQQSNALKKILITQTKRYKFSTVGMAGVSYVRM